MLPVCSGLIAELKSDIIQDDCEVVAKHLIETEKINKGNPAPGASKHELVVVFTKEFNPNVSHQPLRFAPLKIHLNPLSAKFFCVCFNLKQMLSTMLNYQYRCLIVS